MPRRSGFAYAAAHMLCAWHACPHPPADRSRHTLAGARRPHRPRSRHQDHRRRRFQSRPTAGDRRRDHPAQGLQGGRGAAAGARRRTQRGGLCARPAHQYGRQRGSARAIDPRLRPQSLHADRSRDRIVGRAAFDRRRRARIDRHGRQPRQTRRSDRRARRDLHPAGRAGSPRKTARRPLKMAVVISALLPVFLLIVLGFILKRSLMRLETQWHGLERLTYYVLFPMLLIQTLVKADLSKVPVAGIGGALLLSALLMSLLCLALRPIFSRWDIDGPAFTSIFQGATRWQTYVALAVSGNLFGETGLALASVAMVAIIPLVNVLSVSVLAHYASPEKQSVRAIVMTVVKNPLIWACAIGLAVNVTHLPLPKIWHEVAEALGRSSLGIGLLVTGAGLQLQGMFRPSLAASVTVFLKLILMPVLAI